MVFDIAERHLRAFVLIDLQLRVVNVWNGLESDYVKSVPSKAN